MLAGFWGGFFAPYSPARAGGEVLGPVIGKLSASNVPVVIQVCREGAHKGEFSTVAGTGTLYYGNKSGRSAKEIYFYVPVKLDVTYREEVIYGPSLQFGDIGDSLYQAGAAFELKEGTTPAFFGDTPNRRVFTLLRQTIARRFMDSIKPDEKERIGNKAGCYIVLAPREGLSIDGITASQQSTKLTMTFFERTAAPRLLKADISPCNEQGDLTIEIITRFVDEKTFLANLPGK
ncbi:MAG: hypothetical protein PHT33_02195 [bacterium]|nr:hypothetical protein [bacterium]